MSGKFNLDDYEPVKARKKRFYSDYKDGRIVVDAIQIDAQHAVFKATLFKNKDDQEKALAFSTGHAFEQKGVGSFANKTSWTENCEESAIGRALDNAGYSGNDKCSREEIVKVQNDSIATPALEKNLSSLSEYTVKFGKFKGKKLNQIPAEEISSYIDYIERSAPSDKPMSAPVLEFIESATAFLGNGSQEDDGFGRL